MPISSIRTLVANRCRLLLVSSISLASVSARRRGSTLASAPLQNRRMVPVDAGVNGLGVWGRRAHAGPADYSNTSIPKSCAPSGERATTLMQPRADVNSCMLSTSYCTSEPCNKSGL